MTTKVKSQISMYDNIIEDKELENVLEQREELKQEVSQYRKIDKTAKNMIRAIDTPAPYRIGRFIISKQTVPAKSVAFETDEGIRINIKTVKE